jgi:hypothetical protein
MIEAENAPLELVGARLHDDRGHRPSGAPELGVEVRGRDADRIDGLRGRDEDREQAGLVIVVDAVDLDVVRKARLTVELRLLAVLGIEELRVRAAQRDAPGYGGPHPLEAPALAQRHVLDQPALDHPASVGPVGLEDRCLLHHLDRLGHRADLEDHVHTNGGVDLHLDAVAGELLEAAQLGRNAVQAVLHVREDVVAALVRHGRSHDVRLGLGGGHGHAGDRRPLRVVHVAEERASDRLGRSGAGGQKRDRAGQKEKRHERRAALVPNGESEHSKPPRPAPEGGRPLRGSHHSYRFRDGMGRRPFDGEIAFNGSHPQWAP